MRRLLLSIFLFSLAICQVKSEQTENLFTESNFYATKVAYFGLSNKYLNWTPPKEPKDLKEFRRSITSKYCTLNTLGISKDCYDKKNLLIKIPNKKWIYTYKYEVSPDETSFFYISDVKRSDGNKNIAIFSTLYITFNTKYEEDVEDWYEISLSQAGEFDRIDCSTRIPIWYSYDQGEWYTTTSDVKDFSYESFKQSAWYYDGMTLEEEDKAYESFKETFGWLQHLCKVSK